MTYEEAIDFINNKNTNSGQKLSWESDTDEN